jgi:hypothetical protein
MFGNFKRRKEQDEILRHVAGATVVHKNPFDNLEIPFRVDNLSQDFISKWITPFYMERLLDSDTYEKKFIQITNDLSPEIVKQLLGYFDWRSRITGAYFAAIMDYKEFEDFIGIHLVKSEVCYAGEGYLTALTLFNTDNSINYLTKYLDYYLSKTDLWFDQGSAMAALIWLDDKNNTTLIKDNNFMGKWTDFVTNKPNWKLDNYVDSFDRKMTKIIGIKDKIKNGM